MKNFKQLDPDETAMRVAKALGISDADMEKEKQAFMSGTQEEHVCHGPKGTLYERMPDGTKRPVTKVLPCRHKAFPVAYEAIMKLHMLVSILSVMTDVDPPQLPTPEDFFFLVTEDVEEDAEVGDVSTAAEYLNSLRRMP